MDLKEMTLVGVNLDLIATTIVMLAIALRETVLSVTAVPLAST